MHTEGSIIFADPDVYDKRRDVAERWRWGQVKELLEPNNSEPCISALLSFFDPFESDDKKYRLQLDAMDFLRRYIESRDAFSELTDSVVSAHGDKKFTRQGMNRQIAWKLAVIAAIESFLMSHWDAGETPLATDDVVKLARGTLAYHLATDEDKLRIESLFSTIAENVAQKVADAERRRSYGRTLYGIYSSQEIENWIGAHLVDLQSAPSPSALLELILPLLKEYIHNDTFQKCSNPDALRLVAQSWILGLPFLTLFQLLGLQGAKLIWGTKFRDFNIEHVVEIYENGLGYDGALLVGAIVELITYLGVDPEGTLTNLLEILQKMLKYGLPTQSAIALYEIGFSDRAIVAELNTALKLEDEQRGEVLQKLRDERGLVAGILQKYPSYFFHIFEQLL
jgi:hypothetical protein